MIYISVRVEIISHPASITKPDLGTGWVANFDDPDQQQVSLCLGYHTFPITDLNTLDFHQAPHRAAVIPAEIPFFPGVRHQTCR